MKKFIFVCFGTFLLASTSFANPIKENFESGMRALSEKKYDDAAGYFRKVIEMHPKFAPAYNYLGLTEKDRGTDIKEVLWCFQKAVEHDPNYVEALTNLGKTYYTMGKFEEAEQASVKALERNPEHPIAHLSLAWTYLLGMSRPDDAIPHFEKALHYTELPYANFGLGLAYFMNDQRIDVLDMITQLRKKGEEGFALELERIIRDRQYEAITERGKPLLIPQLTSRASQLIPDLPVNEIAESPEANRPVRVRKAGSPPATTTQSETPAITGAERIRQLQESSRNAPQN